MISELDCQAHIELLLKDPKMSFSSDDLSSDPMILKHVGSNQEVLFVEQVSKFNDYNWKQSRVLVVTKTKILSLKQKRFLRREVVIKNLQGVTINLKHPQEVVLHVQNEPDLRFMCQHRKQLIDTLKVQFIKSSRFKNENLPIYGVEASSLQTYEKTASDVKKGVDSKEPDDLERLEEEDLVKMDLNEAVCLGLSDHEEDERSGNSSGSGIEIHEESKSRTQTVTADDIGFDIDQFNRQMRVEYQGDNSPPNNLYSLVDTRINNKIHKKSID